MSDKINPAHYQRQPVQCIEFTQWLNFCLGNAFKYIWRYAEKGGLEDLQKAEWYLMHQISEDTVYYELEPDVWEFGMASLNICHFGALQGQALAEIWSAVWQDSGKELPAALDLVRRMMEVAGAVADAEAGI